MWRKTKEFESLYEISNEGEVRNLKTGALIAGSINSYGYRVVRLRKNGKNYDYKFHRLFRKTNRAINSRWKIHCVMAKRQYDSKLFKVLPYDYK